MSTGKAKTLLEKALNADPNHLPAIYLLAEIYEQDLEVVSFLNVFDIEVCNIPENII